MDDPDVVLPHPGCRFGLIIIHVCTVLTATPCASWTPSVVVPWLQLATMKACFTPSPPNSSRKWAHGPMDGS